jgi:UDP-GlcNAc:undecaprenyl-phosphate GlcNAc-1-phosphate transferase
MLSLLISFGVTSFMIAFFATLFVRFAATKWHILDHPHHPKNVHKHPIPRLGGFAIFFAVTIAVVASLLMSKWLVSGEIQYVQYIGFLLGGLILMIGGYVDDRFDLPPRLAIIAPLIASLTVILFGVNIEKLTNPFGGVIYLAAWQSNILVFVWLMVVMYTTKFLDGLDGLATSVTSIGTLMVLLLALTVAYFQPDVALLAAIVLGAELGFLFWNFHPASIFLGEGGSTLVGYLVGMLAVISGGKLATALLVLGVPLLDVLWIILRRFRVGGIKQIFIGDRKHLHHRLLDRGWSQTQIVLFYIFVAGLFGVSTLFLQSQEKLIALVLLSGLMLIAAAFFVKKEKVR